MQPWKGFEYTMARVHGLLKIRKQMSTQQGRARPRREVSDLLRSALVLAVSAFDAYCHDCLAFYARDGLVRVLNNDCLTEELQKFIKDHFKPTDLCKMLVKADPQEEFIKAFVGCYDNRSFQDVGRIEKVFAFLGIEGICEKVATRLGQSRDQLAGRMAKIFSSRHSIVHSGDYVEGAQGRPKQKGIRAPAVQDDIRWLTDVTEAFDAVVKSALSASPGPVAEKGSAELRTTVS